jgi:hypothetical protein
MFIPKSKMPSLLKMIGFVLDEHPEPDEFFNEEELELFRQLHDKASLVQHGDANFLEVSAYYGVKPERGF